MPETEIELPLYLFQIEEINPQLYYSQILPDKKIPEDKPAEAALEIFKKMFVAYDNLEEARAGDYRASVDKFKRALFENKMEILDSVQLDDHPELIEAAFKHYKKTMGGMSASDTINTSKFSKTWVENTNVWIKEEMVPHALSGAVAEFYNGLAAKNDLPTKINAFGGPYVD